MNTEGLIAAFKEHKQGVTIVDGHGAIGPVKVIFTVVKRTTKDEIIKLIHEHSPDAFYSVEDVKSSSHGFYKTGDNASAIKRILTLSK